MHSTVCISEVKLSYTAHNRCVANFDPALAKQNHNPAPLTHFRGESPTSSHYLIQANAGQMSPISAQHFTIAVIHMYGILFANTFDPRQAVDI